MDAPVDPEVKLPSRKRILAYEVAAVSSIIVLPMLASASFHYGRGGATYTYFDYGTTITGICGRIGFPLVLLFVMWSSGDPLATFGLVKWKWGRDIPLAIIALGAMILSLYALDFLLGRQWKHYPPPYEQLPLRYGLVALYFLVIGFREELFYRAYLIPRLTELSGKAFVAVLISTALFGCEHLYQGWVQASFAAFHGLILAILFLAGRRTWPLMLAHGIYDFYVFFMNYH